MKHRTVSFHTLLTIVGMILSILSAVFVGRHEGSEYYGWDCVPMIYFAFSVVVLPLWFVLWGLSNGFLERVWKWNPTFTLGKKSSIPKARIVKDDR